MAKSRVTSVTAEVLATASSRARVSAIAVEALASVARSAPPRADPEVVDRAGNPTSHAGRYVFYLELCSTFVKELTAAPD
jgi:hypothetical protein